MAKELHLHIPYSPSVGNKIIISDEKYEIIKVNTTLLPGFMNISVKKCKE